MLHIANLANNLCDDYSYVDEILFHIENIPIFVEFLFYISFGVFLLLLLFLQWFDAPNIKYSMDGKVVVVCVCVFFLFW